jgi:transcriptional regulator with XRE-family HTH domain
MKSFGNTIKLLLMDRGITAKEFAGRINLSETSLSKIVQGVSKPRQANLTRIIEELCETPEEQQQLIAAYARIQDALSDEAAQLDQAVYDRVEEDRVRSYLQAKSQSIAFRESVAAELTDAGINFQGPHQNQDIICDFFIPGTPSIAIECKSNPSRDWDRTITSARLLRQELPCDQVFVVVPALEAISKTDQKRLNAAAILLVASCQLASELLKGGSK